MTRLLYLLAGTRELKLLELTTPLALLLDWDLAVVEVPSLVLVPDLDEELVAFNNFGVFNTSVPTNKPPFKLNTNLLAVVEILCHTFYIFVERLRCLLMIELPHSEMPILEEAFIVIA